MLQIIFISIALALALSALIVTSLKRIAAARTLFLLSSGFFLAYTVVLFININYSFISHAEIAYIILMIFALVVFMFLLISYIRKRN